MPFTGKATYDGGAALPELVDDVSDLVRLISPFDTPLLDAIGDPRYAAKSTRHEWAGGENFTQIFTESVMIQGGLDAVGLHAVEREFGYQVIQRLRELLRLLEQSVINGYKAESGGTGDASYARRTMDGIVSMLAKRGKNIPSSAQPLDEKMLNAAIGLAGPLSAGAIVCNGFQKRKISTFNQSGRHYEPESTVLRNLVDVYESDFGVQRVILSRWVPADKVLLLDLDKIQVLPLAGRSFFARRLVESGDFRKAQIVGEYTLEMLDGAGAFLENLAVA